MKILCNKYFVRVRFGYATLYSRSTGNVAQKDIPSFILDGLYLFVPKHIRGVFLCLDRDGTGAKWISKPICEIEGVFNTPDDLVFCSDWMNSA